MKTNIHFGILALWLIFLLVPLTSAAIPLSNSNNQHNFSSGAANTNPTTSNPHPHADSPDNLVSPGTSEICIFCHTPHNAAPQSSLWNRRDPDSMGSFPVYGGQLVIKGSFNVTDATLHSQYNSATFPYPNGASKLCLSCHDGVTAIGTVLDGTAFNMLNASNISAMNDPRLVIDLAVSHPISFVYDSQVLSDVSQVKPGQYRLPTLIDVPLDGQQRMQCTTCHDPHEDTRSEPHGLPFWRHNTNTVVSEFEDVCNDCHLADKTGPPAPVLHNM
ncbi:MAG: hypothetical protein NDI73_04865 [Desulfuromonadales bacterium]|nr:hypothetical protein [Desulfuromonadales bacterium]